jgi:hypothetical protein
MTVPVGRRGQTVNDDIWDFSGAIIEGGVAQLILPQQPRRVLLLLENASDENLWFGVGPATATATISGGKVASVAVDNGGIGYTVTPQVVFLGGIVDGDYQQNAPAGYPFRPAVAQAALSGGAVNAITVSDGGLGYLVAPRVYLFNSMPALGGGAYEPSGTLGIVLVPGGSAIYDSNDCPWSPVAVWGGTTDQAYVCQVMIS